MTEDSSTTGCDPHDDIKSAIQDEHVLDELFDKLTAGFGEACVTNNVKTAIAIAIHPDKSIPIIFVRGHKYDIAAALARVLSSLKKEMLDELDTN